MGELLEREIHRQDMELLRRRLAAASGEEKRLWEQEAEMWELLQDDLSVPNPLHYVD